MVERTSPPLLIESRTMLKFESVDAVDTRSFELGQRFSLSRAGRSRDHGMA